MTSLYIHIPWCIKKCPYCDFNSHKSNAALEEKRYVQRLLDDLAQDIEHFGPRPLSSIFIGGGTPSLFQPSSFETLFAGIQKCLPFEKNIEITMEANPGTAEQQRFQGYRLAGINRLSLGIQSFHTAQLKALGRIHDGAQSRRAINMAQQAGFTRINLDIMHGLPGQSLDNGLDDLRIALSHAPEHLSWYQLTIEPNTVFYKKKPSLPNEDLLDALEQKGLLLLAESGYERYEISAFCKDKRYAQHNLNYWRYGDYFGIGAGAHGKLTQSDGRITRTQKSRQPHSYMDEKLTDIVQIKPVSKEDILFEYLLNTTRLEGWQTLEAVSAVTPHTPHALEKTLAAAQEKGFVDLAQGKWRVTTLGRRFTNDLQGIFL